MDARRAATLLLRLGTVPFVALPLSWLVAPAPPPSIDGALRVALVCHAGIILGFVGGLQQAAAIATRAPAAIALGAIATALVGTCAVLAAALRVLATDDYSDAFHRVGAQ